MKSASLYEYRDYKAFLTDRIGESGRGERKRMAAAINCQVSHVTHVLSGAGHFSQEQAEAAARHLGLDGQETEFFLLLVGYNRAGTRSLKKFYERLLGEKQEKYSRLKSRLKMPDSLGTQEEAVYYSSWHFGAVHVLLSIPGYRTREAVAAKLGISLPRVDEILQFLVGSGLCRKEGGTYLLTRSLLHLDKGSPLISKHHTNWRLRALQALDPAAEDSLHYSSVFSVAKKDYPKVREILAAALSECLRLVTASPEEEVVALGMDLFRI